MASLDMDYPALRDRAIRRLEQLAGEEWTDFNAHDPGITILEQLCYAVSDVAYRIHHPLPDVLAGGGGGLASLPPPAAILPCQAVTREDLQRVVLGVDGVRHADVESTDLRLFYDPSRRSLGRGDGPSGSEPVVVRGLHRVLVEPLGSVLEAELDGDESRGASSLLGRIAERLHGQRVLGEDFAEIRLLEPEPVRIHAVVEIEAVADPSHIHVEVLGQLAHHVTPRMDSRSLRSRLKSGEPLDEILNGPLPSGGVAPWPGGEPGGRMAAIRASDLIRVIMDAHGVRTVVSLDMRSGGRIEPWSLSLDPSRFPRLDAEGSNLRFVVSGHEVRSDFPRVMAKFHEIQAAEASSHRAENGLEEALSALAPSAGKDRQIGRFRSIQHQFPSGYGVGENGLPGEASVRRRGLARQLRAYLSFFDQLLAQQTAQLAHAGALLALAPSPDKTYFSQPIEDPDVGLEAIRVRDPESHRAALEAMTSEAERDGAQGGSRRQKFQEHLLARFAEDPPRDADRSGLLEHVAELGRLRGTGVDLLRGGESGLERRLRMLVNLRRDEGEDLVLVEHILLRPVDEDPAEIPLLTEASYRDPFAHRISFVLPAAGRFTVAGARRRVEHVVRAETPAHLALEVRWLEIEDWPPFRDLWAQFLVAVGEFRRLPGQASSASTFKFQTLRDELIERLELAEVKPLRDVAYSLVLPTPDPWTIAGRPISVVLEPSQPGVEYQVFGRPLANADFVTSESSGAPLFQIPELPDLRIRQPAPPAASFPTSSHLPGEVRSVSHGVIGHGGSLNMALDELCDDTLLWVRAEQHGEVSWLEPPLLVLIAPDPEVALGLQVRGSEEGLELQIADGEKGTFYHFGSTSEPGLSFPLPAYFHRPEDTVGRARVELDLVIPRSDRELPPSLELEAVTDDLEVRIDARRARTGLSATLTEKAILAPLPTVRLDPGDVLPGDKARLVVEKSREGERYQPFCEGLPVKRALNGTGGKLVFLTEPVHQDTRVEMRVERPGAAGLPVTRVSTLWIRPRVEDGE